MKKIIGGIAAGFALLSVVGVAQAALLTPSASGKVAITGTVAGDLYEVQTQYNVDYIYTLDQPFSAYPLGGFDTPFNDFASIELSGIGSSVFDLSLWVPSGGSGAWNKVAELSAATSASYDFMVSGVGVDLFKIAVRHLDQPVGPFVTGLTFAKTEDSTVFFQNAIASKGTVPEPATFLLIGSGLLGMGWRRKKS